MKNRFQQITFRQSKRRCDAFTLVELLTATSVSILLIAALLLVTQTFLSNYQNIRGGTLSEGDAGVALDMMIHDLEALAVTAVEGSQSLLVEADPRDQDEGSADDEDRQWLTLLSTAIDTEPDGYQGTMRAVSYRLAYKDPLGAASGADPKYALYRTVAGAEDTFNNAVGVADLIDDYWEEGGTDTTAVTNYLVGNIVRFEIRFQYTDPADDQIKWTTSTQTVTLGENGAFVDGTRIPDGFLAAEISLTSLDSQGATLLQSGGISMDDAIQRFSRSYVRKTALFPNSG